MPGRRGSCRTGYLATGGSDAGAALLPCRRRGRRREDLRLWRLRSGCRGTTSIRRGRVFPRHLRPRNRSVVTRAGGTQVSSSLPTQALARLLRRRRDVAVQVLRQGADRDADSGPRTGDRDGESTGSSALAEPPLVDLVRCREGPLGAPGGPAAVGEQPGLRSGELPGRRPNCGGGRAAALPVLRHHRDGARRSGLRHRGHGPHPQPSARPPRDPERIRGVRRRQRRVAPDRAAGDAALATRGPPWIDRVGSSSSGATRRR